MIGLKKVLEYYKIEIIISIFLGLNLIFIRFLLIFISIILIISKLFLIDRNTKCQKSVSFAYHSTNIYSWRFRQYCVVFNHTSIAYLIYYDLLSSDFFLLHTYNIIHVRSSVCVCFNRFSKKKVIKEFHMKRVNIDTYSRFNKHFLSNLIKRRRFKALFSWLDNFFFPVLIKFQGNGAI